MRKWLLVFGILVFVVSGSVSYAQWHGGYSRFGGYGYGGYGYGGYGGDVGTAYSADVRARAAFAMAQGAAAESYARSNQANELARSQYIDNESKYIQMRRDLRAATEAGQEQRKADERAKAALRPPPKTPAQIYPRLGSDQRDPLTGKIRWPEPFLDKEFQDDRTTVEAALQTQVEYDGSQRTSKIVFDAAHRMMKTLSADYAKVGAEHYSSSRRFLNSLSVEGDQAMEGLK